MQKKCPYCGAALEAGATFCPHCARGLLERTHWEAPQVRRRFPIRVALAVAAAVLALAAAGYGIWDHYRPKIYDEEGPELLYTDRDGTTYQVLVSWRDLPHDSAEEICQTVEDRPEEEYRFPLCLFVNRADTGADAAAEFERQVASVTAEFVQTENPDAPWSCTLPSPSPDYVPRALRLSSIDFTSRSGAGRLRWTVRLRSGDVLRLYQTITAYPIPIVRYDAENTPLDTVEDVQNLLDSLRGVMENEECVEIYLPPVEYEGGLTVNQTAVRIYGAEDENGRRTTFRGPLRFTQYNDGISYLDNVDVLGDGRGQGVQASARVHLTNCRVAGWETGVLLFGDQGWVNLMDCVVEDNGVGFHINTNSGNITHSRYTDNVFRSNGTAILLERGGTGVSLGFAGTVFTGNGTDIDNRCSWPLELEEAVFDP